jgi:hypothetical protein
MATSRSPSRWTAIAEIFSGRENPQWSVADDESQALVRRWSQLPRAGDSIQHYRPRLGYRGCQLRSPDGSTWHAFDGIVCAVGPDGHQSARIDETGDWERSLLSTAPAGLLPAPPHWDEAELIGDGRRSPPTCPWAKRSSRSGERD